MGTIRVGAQVHPQHADYPTMRGAWSALEQIGVDTLWNWDHFFPLSGDRDGMHFECWTLLAAMARETEGVRFGPLVVCDSYRNPHLVADMARTVDHLSGGRFILGMGAGWFERDFREYGYEFRSTGERLRGLEASLRTIRQRLGRLNPPPVQDRLPILVGGGGERVTLRIVAEQADMWNSLGPLRRFTHKNRVLDDWCARVGRDPAEIERSVLIRPGEVGRADDFAAAGATHLIVGLDPGDDLRSAEQLVAWRESVS